jgi:radical SAM protein with 4Fe4S-binding SPASM domain
VDTVGMLGLRELVASFTSEYEEINTLFAEKLTFAIKTPLCIWPRDFIEKLKRRKQLQPTCQFQHRSGIIFDPKGQISACNSLANFPMGMMDENYNNAESLIRIFNSDDVVRVYNHMNSYPSETCINCPDNSFCRGGCPLMWAVYNASECILGW